MAPPPFWKFVVNFSPDLEYSSRLLKSDVCPCRYCWSEKCGMSFFRISDLCPNPAESSSQAEAADPSEPPQWKLITIFNDGAEFPSRLHDSESCPCSKCWCDETTKLQVSDFVLPTLWILESSKPIDSPNELMFETRPVENRRTTSTKLLDSASPNEKQPGVIKQTAEDGIESFYMNPVPIVHPEVAPTPTTLKNESPVSTTGEKFDINNKSLLKANQQLPHKCALCSERFETKKDRLAHQNSHKDSRGLFKCKHCPVTHRHLSNLLVHVFIHTGEKPYKCDLCEKAFNKLHNLGRHKLTHTGKRPFKCDKCPRSFRHQRSLTMHKRDHAPTTMGDSSKHFKLLSCPARFETKRKKLNHQRFPRGSKISYKCNPSSSSQKTALGKNLRTSSKLRASRAKCAKEEDDGDISKLPPRQHDCAAETGAGASSRTYTCRLCSKVFGRRKQLNEHMESHDEPFQCCLCESKFKLLRNKQIHFRQHKNRKTGRYHCNQCDYTSKLTGSMPIHMRVHTGERPYECVECHLTFPYAQMLMAHRQKCPKSSSTSNGGVNGPAESDEIGSPLKNHSLDGRTSSDPSESPSKLALEVNVPVDTVDLEACDSSQLIVCNLCDSTFSTKKQLSIHLIKKHQDDDGRYFCTNCDVTCTLISTMVKHMETHQQKTVYKCAFCREPFTDLKELASHDAKVHIVRRRGKQHQCDQCSKAFFRSSDLQQHKRIHTGEKPYRCDRCSKAFVQLTQLQQHKSTHTKRKPYKCFQCKATFKSPCARSQHKKKMHPAEDERLKESATCSTVKEEPDEKLKKMSSLDIQKKEKEKVPGKGRFQCQWPLLNAREKEVSGERKFQCQLCSKLFVRKDHLQRHTRIHTGERPFKCRHCSKRFIEKHKMYKHSLTH